MISHYRMTSFAASILILLSAAGIASPQAKPAPQEKLTPQETADMREVRGFRLNLDVLNKYDGAVKAIAKAVKDDPDLKKQMDAETGEQSSIDASVKTLEKYPPITAAIKSAGLSNRQYIVMTGTLIGTVLAVGLKRQGQIKAYPPPISPENAAFVEQNYDKVNAIAQRAAEAYNVEKYN